MKKDHLMFLVAVCFVIFTFRLMVICFAQNLPARPNEACVGYEPSHNCSSGGTALCSAASECNEDVKCSYCDTGSSVTQPDCVGWEGQNCHPLAIYPAKMSPCFDGIRKIGNCEGVKNNCSCDNIRNTSQRCDEFYVDYVPCQL